MFTEYLYYTQLTHLRTTFSHFFSLSPSLPTYPSLPPCRIAHMQGGVVGLGSEEALNDLACEKGLVPRTTYILVKKEVVFFFLSVRPL